MVFKCSTCGCEATGVGGAKGLCAVGWWFQEGVITRDGLAVHVLACPTHHPKGPVVAKAQADAIQAQIRMAGF